VSGWPTAALATLGEIVTGATPRTAEAAFFGGPIPFVTPSDLDAQEPVSMASRTLSELGAAEVRPVPSGAVMVCCIGSLGKVGIAGTRVATNQQINSVVFNSEKIDPRYGFYACKRIGPDLEKHSSSTTVAIINKSAFGRIEIPLPPLPEQRRIAAILDEADALRAKRRAALAQLDEMAQANFVEMFGDLRHNSKNWPLRPISSIVLEFAGGKSIEADTDNRIAAYRVLKVSAVTSGIFKPAESKPLPSTYLPPSTHLVRPHDLLFSRANTTELVGAVAYVEATPPNLALPDKLWKFVWHEPRVADPLFVWALFQDQAVREEIGRRATGTSGSMKNISQSKLLSMPIATPPLEMQQAFSTKLRHIWSLKRCQRDALASAESLFTSLQHRAFRGEL